MDDEMFYGDEFPDISGIDEDVLRAYLEGDTVNPEIEELLKGRFQLLIGIETTC
ncbi:hypothetical protein DPMN_117875 [Dreissena polymorpha]|uniref:Uncharacterized protein n=1 Tax=Dreissena polymorpha TaxID=45954 RepID=A0A9D4GJT3_DREPO|nr:hypothetical protein DPMN_117875 [Dreissena polymorpha]